MFLLYLRRADIAKNAPIRYVQRKGMIKRRSQTFNPVIKKWVKRNVETGQFMDMKSDSKTFKGVGKDKN